MKRVKWRAPVDEDLDVRGRDPRRERRRFDPWLGLEDEDLDDDGLELDEWDDWTDEDDLERARWRGRRSG